MTGLSEPFPSPTCVLTIWQQFFCLHIWLQRSRARLTREAYLFYAM